MQNVESIISKVREMYKNDDAIKEIISCPATIRGYERDGKVATYSIIFNYFGLGDHVSVTPTAIRHYKRDRDTWETLITYESFDELMRVSN